MTGILAIPASVSSAVAPGHPATDKVRRRVTAKARRAASAVVDRVATAHFGRPPAVVQRPAPPVHHLNLCPTSI